jgi:hypothetical protein
MTKISRTVFLVMMCLVLSMSLVTCAFAANGNNSGILCVSHSGDLALYESNSQEAVLSAFEKGADFVSVNVRKDADGMLVLCSENKTDVSGVLLADMLSQLGENNVLILDFANELRDEVYTLVESKDAFSKAIIRLNDGAKNIVNWLNGKNKNLQVIGVYDSFVVFTAISHIKTLGEADMQIVGYQSKNYFNEMFGSLFSKALKKENMPKAMTSTYDPDLCGQRSDSEDGWNDLIKKGYSVIETNNIDAFLGYINSNNNVRKELETAYEKAMLIDADKYNTVSRENLSDAVETAGNLLKSEVASNDELQNGLSKLRFAIENLTFRTDEDTQKGALNITAGKVMATLLVGMAILAAQIYTYKMQRHKKK